jgi:hypothetical protein
MESSQAPQGPSQLHRIAMATLSLLAVTNPSVAFASKFTDCKSQALGRYNTAVLEADPENAKRAIIESTACDRFISQLPKEEQEKIKHFQEEMLRFQDEQLKNRT